MTNGAKAEEQKVDINTDVGNRHNDLDSIIFLQFLGQSGQESLLEEFVPLRA